jgi:hypothetical protein
VIELWQVPLLVIAVVVIVDFIARAVAKRWRLPSERRKQLKTGALALLAVIGAALLWVAWPLYGTSTLASVAAVAQTLIEAATLWLTYQAYKEAKAASHKPDTDKVS